LRILLVDDDRMTRSMAARMLRLQGHEVVEAGDGEQAWQAIEREQINFVVSDWIMPNLDGVELCRRIRAAQMPSYVYVILCTSKGERSDLIEGMDAGADDFLVKPISSEELRVKVRAGERILTLERGLEDRNRQLEEVHTRLQKAHALLEEDLQAAARLQKAMLPSASLETNGIRCRWHFHPCSYIAGDIFNFFELDEDAIGFYILDVSGHGVPAAMLSITLSVVLTPDSIEGNILKQYDAAADKYKAAFPNDVIQDLNRRFHSRDDRYFTMIYGIIDLQSSTLRIGQAGHPSPVLARGGGSCETLGTGGMPIGVWPEMDFDCIQTPIAAGDRLVLYSDGVTECLNPRGEQFGEQRLLEAVEAVHGKDLDTMFAGLIERINAWREGREPDDDISLLVVEMVRD
jgi:sigma-B regulation protein RsbU (phosphoserine phosphatase)